MEDLFKIIKIVYAFLGVFKPNWMSEKLWKCCRFFEIFTALIYFPSIAIKIIISNDFKQIVTALLFFISGSHIYLKHIFLRIYRKDVIDIMEGIEEAMIQQRKNNDKRLIVDKAIQSSNLLTKFFVFSYQLFGIALLPLSFIPSENNPDRLFHPGYLPWDLKDPINHAVTIILQGCGLLTVILLVSGLYPSVVFNILSINSQIRTLMVQLKGLDGSSREDLIDCIKQHNFILCLVRKFNRIFSISLLYDVTVSPVQCCLAAYIVSVTDVTDPSLYLNVTYLGLALMQPLFVSWCGQVLYNSSQEIGDALFSSNWHQTQSQQYRKDVLLYITALKVPCTLNLKKEFFIDYTTYSAFLSATYSYFTILKILEKKNSPL